MKDLLRYLAWKFKFRWQLVGGHWCDKLGRHACEGKPAGYVFVYMHTRTHEIMTEIEWL